MKKKILQRCLLGAPIGLLICQIISILSSLILNDGTYYAVVPELITICKSEINAVIIQTICALIYGSMWAVSSVIWGIDKLSIFKQSFIHFLITSIFTFPIACITRWMNHTFFGVLSYFGIFATIYFIIWIIQYLLMRKKIKQLNTKIKYNNQDN